MGQNRSASLGTVLFSDEEMNRLDVSFVRVRKEFGVQASVRRAMNLAHFGNALPNGTILVKVNLSSDIKVPSQNTSPWVLEGVLAVLKDLYSSDILVADSDTTSSNVERASLLWGFKQICDRYNVKFVNLTKDKLMKVDIGGEVFKEVLLPETLLNVDSIVTVPVIKTHQITGITCSLKNQWGCLPTFRHQYHLVVDRAIVEINKFLRPKFAVADGTICMEGQGPRTGKPRVCNVIMASQDLVALDSAACRFIGMHPEQVRHITLAQEEGLGSMEFRPVGDDFFSFDFVPPSKNIVGSMEFLARRSAISRLIFGTPLLHLFTWGARMYNRYWWFLSKGKGYTEEVLRNSWYKDEFKERG